MSEVIDEKVVEMRFNNQQFEEGCAQTMSTLQKLKASLKIDGAVSGLNEMSSSIKNMNFSGISSGITDIQNRSSMLEKFLNQYMIGTIRSLADQTTSWLTQTAKSMTGLANMQEGFKKFSDKTTSVATIVAQGYALEEVNDQLDKLNWFSDETSYSFTDMVNNIGKFTATGQKLDESVKAMEGIATWAALSGQNAQTASRAMYNIAQAMSMGKMKMQDWKSIQIASMDTKEFRQNAVDAAVALGKLKETGKGTFTYLGKNFTLNELFGEGLSKGWFDKDVMMSTFSKYSSAIEDIYNYAEEHGVTASEAMHDLSDSLDSFGVKAFKAAQEARTFKDAIDSVKDAVSTSWMKTFEYIIGDQKEATALFTELANILYDAFNSGGARRNEMLKEWKELGGRTVLLRSLVKILDNVVNAINSVKYAFREVFPPSTANGLYNITSAFEHLVDYFALSDQELLDLRNTFKGLFVWIKTCKDILASILKALFPNLLKDTKDLRSMILRITSVVGILITKWSEWITKNQILQKTTGVLRVAISAIANSIMFIIGVVITLFDKIKNSPIIIKTLEKIGSVLEKIATILVGAVLVSINAIKNILEKLSNNKLLNDVKNGSLSNSIDNLKNSIKEFIKNGLEKVLGSSEKAEKVLLKLTKGLDFIKKGFSNIGKFLSDIGNWILDSVKKMSFGSVLMLAGISAIFISILSLIKKIKTIGGYGETIAKSFEGMIKSFKGMPDQFTKMTKDFKGFLDEITKKRKTDPAETMLKIAISIGILAGSLFLVSRIPSDKILKATIAITSIVGALTLYTAAMAGLSYWQKKSDFNIKTDIKSIASLVIFTGLMGDIVTKVGKLTPEQVNNGLVVVGSCVGLVTALSLLSTLIGKIDTKVNISIIVTLGAMMLALAELSFIIYKLKDVNPINGIIAIGSMIAALFALTGLMAILRKFNGKEVSLKTIISISILSSALSKIGEGLEKASKHNWKQIIVAAVSMTGAMAAMLFIISLFKGTQIKNIIVTAISLRILSSSFDILASVMSKFQEIDWANVNKGVGALIGLTAAFAALSLIGTISKGIGALAELAAGASFILLGIGLNFIANSFEKLAPALELMDGINIISISKGLASLLGVLGIFSIIGPALIPVAGALLITSKAIIPFTQAFDAFISTLNNNQSLLTSNIINSISISLIKFSAAALVASLGMAAISIPAILLGASLLTAGVGAFYFAKASVELAKGLKLLESVDLSVFVNTADKVGSIFLKSGVGMAAFSGSLIALSISLSALALPALLFSIVLTKLAQALLYFGGAMLLGGVGIIALAAGLKLLELVDFDKISEGIFKNLITILAVISVSTQLSVSAVLISRAFKMIGSAIMMLGIGALTGAIGVAIIAGCINKIVDSIKQLSELNGLNFVSSLIALSIGLMALTTAVRQASSIGISLVFISTGLKQLSDTLKELYIPDGKGFILSMISISSGLMIISFAGKEITNAIAGIYIGGLALEALGKSVKILCDNLPSGINFAVLMASLSVGLILLSQCSTQLSKASGAFITSSVGIFVLSKSLNSLNTVIITGDKIIDLSHGLMSLAMAGNILAMTSGGLIIAGISLKVLSSGIDSLSKSITNYVNSVNTKEFINSTAMLGKYTGLGFVEGLESTFSMVSKLVFLMCNNGVLKTIATVLGIHSPSKETANLFKYVPAGGAKGIAEATPVLRKATSTMCQGTLATMADTVSKSEEIGEQIPVAEAKGIDANSGAVESAAASSGANSGQSFIEWFMSIVSSGLEKLQGILSGIGINFDLDSLGLGDIKNEIEGLTDSAKAYKDVMKESDSYTSRLFGYDRTSVADSSMVSAMETNLSRIWGKDTREYKAAFAKEMKRRGYTYDVKTKQWTITTHVKGEWDDLYDTGNAYSGLPEDIDGIGGALDDTNSKGKSLNETIKDSIKLFERFKNLKLDKTLTGNKLLGNMKSQIDGAADWAKDLGSLQGKISKEFYTELLNEGVSSYDKVIELMDMSSAQLFYADELYKQRSTDALKYAQELGHGFVDLTADTDELAKSMESIAPGIKMSTTQIDAMKDSLMQYAYQIVDVEEGTDVTVEQVNAMSAAFLKANPQIAAMGMTIEDVSIQILGLSTDITTMADDIKDSLEGSMNLFENYSKSFDKTPRDMQRALNTQVAAMSSWSQDMIKLSERGISEGLMKELRELGVGGADTVRAFVNMTDEQLKDYQKAWDEAQGKPEEFAKVLALAMNGAKVQMDGTIEGMSADLYLLKCNIEDTIKSSMDAFGGMSLEKTSMQQMTKDLLTNFKGTADYAKGIQQLAKKGINEELLKSLRDMGPKATKYIQAMNGATKKELENYNKLWVIQNTDWADIMSRLVATGDAESLRLAEVVSKNLEKISDATFKTMAEVQEDLKSGIKSSIKMFEAYNDDFQLTPEKALENVKSQVAGIKKWSSNLQKLAGKNISDEFLQYLTDLGPEGAETINAIVQMSASELAETDKYVQEALKLDETESKKIVESYKQQGRNFSDGILEGLDVNAIMSAYEKAAKDGCDAYAIGQDSHSPSKKAISMAGDFGDGVVIGLQNSSSNVEKANKQLASKGVAAARGVMSTDKGKDIGKNLVKGIIIGINSVNITKELTTFTNKFVNTIRNLFGIHSPSTVMEDLFQYVPMGAAEGVLNNLKYVYDAAAAMANETTEGFEDTYGDSIASIINWDDLNPTITPHMDLSEVTDGVRRLNAMMNEQKALTVGASTSGESTGAKAGMTFIQNNYSPKALSRVEIYRQTKNQFSQLKGMA